MIAFFDTSVHVAMLRGELTFDSVLQRANVGPIRLSPVVASEMLRGSRRDGRKSVEALIVGMPTIEPPSWRNAFLEAGRLLPEFFARHDDVGLARLQNDTLLALTARHTGALLVTRDRHFATLHARLTFACVVI